MRSYSSRANACALAARDSPGPSTTASACDRLQRGLDRLAAERAVVVGQADVHRLEQAHRERELERARGADRHVAGAGAHRGHRGHARRAGQPVRAADHEHDAARELRRGRRPARDAAQHAGADQPDVGLPGRAARDADVDDVHAARVALARVNHSPGLARGTSPSCRARTATPTISPVEASTPLGTSAATTGARAALMAAMTASSGIARRRRSSPCRAARRRSRARAASRAASNGSGASPGRRAAISRASPENSLGGEDEQHVDLAARLAQQPRGDEAVAAVVALAADDGDARARARARATTLRQSLPRALHQLERRDRPARSIAQRPIARICVGVGQRLEPARQAHAHASPRPRRPCRAECVSEIVARRRRAAARSRRGVPGQAHRRRAAAADDLDVVRAPDARARAPWRPPPWRRSAPRGAAPGARGPRA